MSRDAKIAALLAIAILLLFADVLFLGAGFYVRDVIRDYLPSRFVLRSIVFAGEFPSWNPFYCGGQPLAANPGFQTFYPLTWLAFLPSFLFGFNFEIVVHVAIAAAGMYLLLRSMDLRVESSLFGALAFSLGGAVLSLTNLLPFLTSIAWWPWIVMFARSRRWGWLALTLAMLLLAGEQSMIVQTAILIACIAPRSNVPRLAAAALLAFAIASVQIVPALDLKRDSGRANGLSYDDATAWSMPAIRPAELFYAHAFGRITDDGAEYRGAVRYRPPRMPLILSIYCGLLVPILAIGGAAMRLEKWTWIAIPVSYLLAIGSNGPLIPLLYRAGVYRSMRYPEKFILLGLFAMIVLAACAFDRIDRKFAPFLILLTLGDLALHVNELAPRMPRRFFAPPNVTRAFEGANRIFNEAEWPVWGNRGPLLEQGDRIYWSQRSALMPFTNALYGLRSIYEIDINVTTLRPMADLVQSLIESLAAGGNVRPFMMIGNAEYLIVPGRPVRILRGPTLPRYWFAEEVVPIRNREDFMRAVREPRSDRAAYVSLAPRGQPGAAVLHQMEKSHSVEIETTGPGLLVASMTAHRYWRATIDGHPAPIMSANIAFQAIEVPAGNHTVRFDYRNPLHAIFGAVSIISLLLAIMLTIYYDH
jgi:hypothetical protein